MKIRVQFEATEAASAAYAFVEQDGLPRKLDAAARAVDRVLAVEEQWTDRIVELLGGLEESDAIELDVDAAVSSDGEDLPFAIEGELEFELEALLETRRDAKVFGNRLLDVVALLERLELTDVQVKIGGRRSSLGALSDAIVRHAGELSVFLTPARERSVGADLDDEDDGDLDDDDEDGDDADLDDDDDEDGDDADLDDDDDEDEEHDDREHGYADPEAHGIPRDGWGARASGPRRPSLTPEELFYLEVTDLSWPCSAEAVRAGIRRAARYHPDLAAHDPALRAVRHEQFTRLTQGKRALLERLLGEVP